MLGIRFTRLGATVGVFAVVGVLAAAGGNARAATGAELSPATGDVKTTVRKSVSQSGTPAGVVTSNTMVTQVSWVGKGKLDVKVPIGTSTGLRDLNQFGGVPTQGDEAVYNREVSGPGDDRIMSPATLQPIKVEATATLDGKAIAPEDVINKTGVLKVKYKLTNTTEKRKTITYTGADGIEVTQEVVSYDPFVGTMAVTLPSGFNEITATGASMTGDGQGGTLLGYTVVLFKPLGDPVAHLEYQARIKDGTLPEASFDLLPIKPYSNPVIESSKDKVASATQLGTEIYGIGDDIGKGADKVAADAGRLLAEMRATQAVAGKFAAQFNGPIQTTANQAAKTATGLNTMASKKVGPQAVKVAADIAALNNGVNNFAALAATLPAYEQFIGTIQDLNASADEVAALTAGPSGPLMTAVNQINTACGATCNVAAQGTRDSIWKNYDPPPSTVTPGINNVINGFTLNAGFGGTYTIPGITYVLGLLATVLPSKLGLASSVLTDPTTAIGQEYLALVAAGPELAGAAKSFGPGSEFETLVDGTNELATTLDGELTTVNSLVPKIESGIKEGPETMITGMDTLQTEGTDVLHAKGAGVVTQYGAELAELNALQQTSDEGGGLPYGPAKGRDTTTTGAYQLTLVAAGSPAKDNAINYVLGILLLIVAGGLGAAMWAHRRRGAA